MRAQVCVDLAVGAERALTAATRADPSLQQRAFSHRAAPLSVAAGAAAFAATSSALEHSGLRGPFAQSIRAADGSP